MDGFALLVHPVRLGRIEPVALLSSVRSPLPSPGRPAATVRRGLYPPLPRLQPHLRS